MIGNYFSCARIILSYEMGVTGKLKDLNNSFEKYKLIYYEKSLNNNKPKIQNNRDESR